MEMNAVLLFTFILGFIAFASGFAIQPYENVNYDSPDEIVGGDKSLDLEIVTTRKVSTINHGVPTTKTTTFTEVTPHTTISNEKLVTTTPSANKITTGDHNVSTTTKTTFTEVTPHTTISDEKLVTTTTSANKTTTGDHNVSTTTTTTFTEVTPHTTISDEKLLTTTPSVHNNDDDYYNDCDCPPQFMIFFLEIVI